MKRWMPAVGVVLFAAMLFTLVWTAKVGAEGGAEISTVRFRWTHMGMNASYTVIEVDGQKFLLVCGPGAVAITKIGE